jgi:hypothetical protein
MGVCVKAGTFSSTSSITVAMATGSSTIIGSGVVMTSSTIETGA